MLPRFFARLRVGDCAYDVRVNDCPVRQNRRGTGTALELPINLWLSTGTNVATFVLAPPDGIAELPAGAHCRLAIVRNDSGASGEGREIHVVVHDDTDKELARDAPERGTVRREGGRVLVESMFTIDERLHPWQWQSSPLIEDGPATVAALLEILAELSTELVQGRLDLAMRRFEARDLQLSIALDEPLNVVRERTRNALEPLVGGGDFTLAALPVASGPGAPELELLGGGRLARLQMPDGKSPLRFTSIDGTTTAQLPVLFHRVDGGHAIIA